MGTTSPGKHCKVIAAFVSLSSHLIMHQIDVTSAHFSVAFNIPLNNISIYFSKLFSFRCLLIAAGTLTEYIVSQISKLIDPDPDPDPGGGDRGGGTRPKNPVPKHIKYRKWISMTCFGAVLFIRLFLLIFLYFSSHLGYHVYVILSIESFFFGYFHASVLALVPEHSLAVALAANASRFFILSIQFVLDLIFYSHPLFMIKLQCWIGVLLTTAAFTSWIYYHESETCNEVPALTTQPSSPDSLALSNVQAHSSPKIKSFIKTFFDAFSPFMMFFAGSMFKDFLFPGVLPYALLHRDRCHIINMLVPVANLIGPIVLFVLESLELFKQWTAAYNVFWLLAIPMGVIFAFSMLAIHTRSPIARRIANSRGRVMMITLGVVFGNGFLDPLSFGGVAKVVKPEAISDRTESRDSTGNEILQGDNSLITFHAISSLFMRFIFSKLSVGYNDTRVSLGYYIPKFRPNHRMSKRNLAWFLIRQTFKRAAKDAITDFRKNIQNYL